MTRAVLSMARLFGQTLRTAPADAGGAGHRLLLRAGLIRRPSSGIVTALPLGLRSLRRIESIIREEMDAIGGQELAMSAVHPARIRQRTGRRSGAGGETLGVHDRPGRDPLPAITREEAVTDLAAGEIHSWRQLPQVVYELRTAVDDESRPPAGPVGIHDLSVMCSHSFDRDAEGLQRSYQAHHQAYARIVRRCGLESVIAVRGDAVMGRGLPAHQFVQPSPAGEETVVRCAACGVAENHRVARLAKPVEDNGPPLPLERVATPGRATIETLAGFLGISVRSTAKAVFFAASPDDAAGLEGDVVVLAMVRGDHEVSRTKLASVLDTHRLRPATVEEIRGIGAEPGYASPIGIHGAAVVVVDDCVWESSNLVSGANVPDVHLRNVTPRRDFAMPAGSAVADIAQVTAGSACAVCGGPLELFSAVEVGTTVQLGARRSTAPGAFFSDEAGGRHPLHTGSYRIGAAGLLACLAEEHHDQGGLRLPGAVAPVDAHVVGIGRGVDETVAAVVATLSDAGLEVLVDDREVSAGVKFADADLIGVPVRITVSPRSLAAGGVELRWRRGGDHTVVEIATVVREIESRRSSGG